MNLKPFFSVVIPTRNRAKLLYLAIKSILNQSFDDFEIIISDNCSNDNTKEIADNFEDKRIRYFRSDKPLTMNENYENALSKANGKYITFLSDDDGFTIDAFRTIKEILDKTNTKLLCWRYCYYYLNDYNQSVEYPLFHPLRKIKKNTLLIPNHTNKLFKVDSIESINNCISSPNRIFTLLNPKPAIPHLTNTVCHYSVIETLKEKELVLFPNNVVPDIYASVLMMATAQEYYFLDSPLTIFCRSSYSTTQKEINKYSFAENFVDKSIKNEMTHVPVNIFINENFWQETFRQAIEDYGIDVSKLNNDKEFYYLSLYNSIKYYENYGFDMRDELNVFENALSEESEVLQNKVGNSINKVERTILSSILTRLPRSGILTKIIARKKTALLHNRYLIIQGYNLKLENIVDCANWLDHKVLSQISNFSIDLYNKKINSLSFKWQIS